MSPHRLGWRPPEDLGRSHRAAMHPQRLGRTAPAGDPWLPPVVDLSPAYPPVYDQGMTSSCTAQALAGAVAYLSGRVPGCEAEQPSRLALYWQERVMEGTSGEDSGAMLGDGVKALLECGWAPEHLWPFDLELLHRSPVTESGGMVGEAMEHRQLIDAEALDWDPASLRWELANGFAIVAGLRVYTALDEVGPDGIIPDPQGPSIGGHAMAVVGYDSAARRFRVRNSWGESWGDRGHGWINEDYLCSEVQCGELWALRAVRVLV